MGQQGNFPKQREFNSLLWKSISDCSEKNIFCDRQKSINKEALHEIIFTLYRCFFGSFSDVRWLYGPGAGDLQEFNATWLKFSGNATGSELAGGEGSTSPAQKDNGSIKLYGCLVGFPEGPALIQVYEKDSTANRAGWGTFSKKGGTADKFIGWFHLRTSDEGWSAVNPNDYTTDTYVPGEMTAKNEKLNFKGYGGQAEKKPATGYTGYALYGVKLGAKTATARSLPFDETTPCPWPSGVYRIQVINPDGATVDPAGPYVEVASGATQAFTFIDPDGYTCAVSLDGAAPSADPWEFTNVTANHSISVACAPTPTPEL